jgi:predicted DNA-binding ribbon-helix-helix protein
VSKLDEIAEYAQSHDFAAEMQDGVWEDEVAADPMVTTSVRLPKSLLDWVREQAEREHVRPSVLIRQWLEQHREVGTNTSVQNLAARVTRLEGTVFPDTRAS